MIRMKTNESPWLMQLDPKRGHRELQENLFADVVIVGGGIAGVTTLYYLMKHTDQRVVLVEGRRLAHGATGHNAGQVVAEFEKPLVHLVREHGLGKAIRGFELMEESWGLLSDILADTEMDIPFREFVGYGGYSEIGQLLADLETELIKNTHGLVSFPVLVSRASGWMAQIPERYRAICTEVEASLVSELLGVRGSDYHAALPEKKATLNSALFTERLALWCLDRFPERAQVFEHAFVLGVELDTAHPRVLTDRAAVSAEKVVLCTNGFENFYIRDRSGLAIDTKFHHLVEGGVGYMTGYLRGARA